MAYDEFVKDRKTYSAAIRELEIIGEAIANLSDDLKEQYPEVLWKQIKSFRNRLIHEYFGKDCIIVWDVVKNELPDLKIQIISILKNL